MSKVIKTKKKQRIIIIHPDLGIGGAERLIVDVAKAMKVLGHDVKVFTGYHDPKRCFEETRGNGILADCIEVHGDWLPRQILGRCTALCATIRMAYVSLMAIFCRRFEPSLIFIDSVSTPLPLFVFARIPSLFYCHFPDKLLCTERKSFLKKAYRAILDSLEENTTGCANKIVVNSKFTADVFSKNFSHLNQFCQPDVLYPTVEIPKVAKSQTVKDKIPYIDNYDIVFTSLNRYERKKNIALAIHAFKLLVSGIGNEHRSLNLLLVIAGGYDERVAENVEYYEELVKLAESIGVKDHVVFKRSICDEERNALLTASTAILYTPANEHFGIVPLEAMSRKTPVVAVRSGGPLETVVDQETGYLCDDTPASFKNAMLQFVLFHTNDLSSRMGIEGRKRVQELFSFEAMVPRVEEYVQETVDRPNMSRIRMYFVRVLQPLISFAIILLGLFVSKMYHTWWIK